MKQLMRTWGMILIALSIGAVSACGNMNEDQTRQQSVEKKQQQGNVKQKNNNTDKRRQHTSGKSSKDNRHHQFKVNNKLQTNTSNMMQAPQQATRQRQDQASNDQVSVVEMDGKVYAPLLTLMHKVGFRYVQQDGETGAYQIGDNDVVYELKRNSDQATKVEENVRLPDSLREMNGQPYISVESLRQLFGDEITAEWNGSDRIDLQPAPDLLPDAAADNLDFAEDPAAQDDKEVWEPLSAEAWDEEAVPALKNISINRMISTAKKYLGVKYKFGAKRYSSSNKRFDCSSYVRYIFDKYGVDLPRTARAQARKGTTVSRKSLKKGDLLYFYVPGRFKKEKTIGHVGIYMGNQKMIHSSPEPKDGVQITNINKSYWKETFVKAKRIVR